VEQGKRGGINVSVILPVYNHARWIGDAIGSVLAQSYTGFELIIIDDASTDASWEAIQAVCHAKQDARLRCIRHSSNQGAPAAINEGLQLACGAYLAILNSDDVWDPARLERLVTLAETDRLDFIATDVALLDADSRRKEQAEPHWTAWFEGLKQDYAVHADIFASLLQGNFLITTSNFFFHRRVYAQLGLFAELRYVHDYDYVLRVLEAGFKLQFLGGEKLLGYRLHDTNTIRERPLAAIEENMHLLLGWLPRLQGMLDGHRMHGLHIQLRNLYRYTHEEWLTAIHTRLQSREQELFVLIADRDTWIADRDQHIQRLQQQLELHRQWVAERDGWIAERDQLVQQYAQGLADRDTWIQDRDGWIAERDVLIRQLQQQQVDLRNSRAFRLGEALLAPLRRFRQLFAGVGYA
jgi:glycosyltransferase involved in cell wall biosynthesis